MMKGACFRNGSAHPGERARCVAAAERYFRELPRRRSPIGAANLLHPKTRVSKKKKPPAHRGGWAGGLNGLISACASGGRSALRSPTWLGPPRNPNRTLFGGAGSESTQSATTRRGNDPDAERAEAPNAGPSTAPCVYSDPIGCDLGSISMAPNRTPRFHPELLLAFFCRTLASNPAAVSETHATHDQR